VKKLVLILVALAALAAPVVASAHPLGNFTVNRFSRIDVSGDRLYVRYVLDLAEIPTYQAGAVDARAYARRIARGAQLSVDGKRSALTALKQRLAHPQGAGGLPTTRLEVILAGPRLSGSSRVEYRDTNFAGRIGWKEIVVGDAASTSDELRSYPKSELESPLDVTSISATLEPADGPAAPPALSSAQSLQAPDRTTDAGFAALIGRGHLSWLVILASLGAAMFWGAAHALSPGHGKAIVTAYLVGQRGTPRHAALLGVITTFTHTIGVFALGGVTLLLSQFIVPERLYPWINLLSGALVIAIGGSVFWSRYRHRRAHRHGHEHHHHHHEHDHAAPSLRGLVAVGVSGGLLPCPSALVVLLAAISLHRVAFGMLLILAFSIGLAAAITGVGLVAVLAKRAFNRVSFEGRLVSALPAISALVILAAGVAMTARALPKVS
jgi:nickel/cobalt transporter (NicO) family protein